jgi:hypothetical protein
MFGSSQRVKPSQLSVFGTTGTPELGIGGRHVTPSFVRSSSGRSCATIPSESRLRPFTVGLFCFTGTRLTALPENLVCH